VIGVAWLAVALAAEQVQPDFSDPKVKRQTQLDILAALVDKGEIQPALYMVKELRAGGVVGPELDRAQAWAMSATGLGGEALVLLEGAARRWPREGATWAALGLAYADAGRVDDAVLAYRRAARRSPRDADVLNNFGFALYAAGDTTAAIGQYRRSLALDPGNPRTRNNLGFALARAENDEDALAAFRAAGGPADAEYNLAVACEQRGDRPSALVHYQAALQLRPEHSLAAAALDRVRSNLESP
jgi:Flp pilus assembly protein TadD